MASTTKLVERFGDEAYFAALCIRSGLVTPELPHRVAQMGLAFERFGMIGGAICAGAIRHGDRVALIDERGELTFRELHERSNAIANVWRKDGLKAGEGVAVLVRNHRGFLETVFAGAKCGARIILLNTSFAGPQIREVATREETDLLVYDEEFSKMLEGVEPHRGRYRAWADEPGEDTLDALIERGSTRTPPKPKEGPRITILTSGTTGTPKGAPRSEPKSLGLLGGLLSKVPFRAREVTELAVPMFHALGFAQAMVAFGLGSTLVVRRKFDPEKTLDSMAEHKATALVVVPVMLSRLVELGEDKINQRDLSELKIIFISGSALGADLAKKALKAFGPVIYNLYGSTEIAYATIATPEDLEAEPSTVGKVVRGSVVKIYDDEGKHERPAGETGRIFVGNLSQFEGYTGGGSKDMVNGLMASGDVGHFDQDDRLFIDGRDDEMIVSGGENVFPAEIEECLASHESIQEAAALGVDDEKFGQRLKAFVVLNDGAQLSEDDIKAYVKDNLANYKVPREIVFVDELPRNQTGKVLKRELDERDEDDASRADDGKAKGGSSAKTSAADKPGAKAGSKPAASAKNGGASRAKASGAKASGAKATGAKATGAKASERDAEKAK